MAADRAAGSPAFVIDVPDGALVLLVGVTGSGKSTFAAAHFQPFEVVSSDTCRGVVANDPTDQAATSDAFDLVQLIIAKRLARRLLTVVDATNAQPQDRAPLIATAKRHHALVVAVVLDLPERLCHERNAERPDRRFGPSVIRRQHEALRRGLEGLHREGLSRVYTLRSVEEVQAVRVARHPLPCDLRHERGPFDVIGDVHGCFEELLALLERLGYRVERVEGPPAGDWDVCPPAARKAVFLGDLVDRGPASPAVLRLVMRMVASGAALCVPGNHDAKLLRKLRGKDVRLTHGLEATLEQLAREAEPGVKPGADAFGARVAAFLDSLASHYVLDGGRLVVAHAGLSEALQGRASGRVRAFALYGDTTGQTDALGLPVRRDWAASYRGRATVVYGHTPVAEPAWVNGTINIDTGCAFGGRLTALRYPERELVSVPARQVYAEPRRPFLPPPAGPTLTPDPHPAI